MGGAGGPPHPPSGGSGPESRDELRRTTAALADILRILLLGRGRAPEVPDDLARAIGGFKPDGHEDSGAGQS